MDRYIAGYMREQIFLNVIILTLVMTLVTCAIVNTLEMNELEKEPIDASYLIMVDRNTCNMYLKPSKYRRVDSLTLLVDRKGKPLKYSLEKEYSCPIEFFSYYSPSYTEDIVPRETKDREERAV